MRLMLILLCIWTHGFSETFTSTRLIKLLSDKYLLWEGYCFKISNVAASCWKMWGPSASRACSIKFLSNAFLWKGIVETKLRFFWRQSWWPQCHRIACNLINNVLFFPIICFKSFAWRSSKFSTAFFCADGILVIITPNIVTSMEMLGKETSIKSKKWRFLWFSFACSTTLFVEFSMTWPSPTKICNRLLTDISSCPFNCIGSVIIWDSLNSSCL